VFIVVVVELFIFILGQRTNLICCSVFDVNGIIGFLNGRRCRRMSSVCEAESDSDAAANNDD
jgi:hypothetical protein